jgi:nucleotide-binding universal stress UspA family protein
MAPPNFRHIAVAIDGSEHARAALEVAIDLAKRYGSQLVILSVAPLQPILVAPGEGFIPAGIPPSDLPRYRGIVEAAVKQAETEGLSAVTGLCTDGVVVDELLAHLEEHPADLLVVGSRGLSAGRRLLLGSVSTAMVTHAPCPVLVVRSGAAGTTKPAA